MKDKPKVQSESQHELDKAQQNFDQFDQSVKDLTMDRMNMAPKQETDSQTKIAQKDIDRSNGIYIKPKRTISSKKKFNEKFREAYNFDKEYVNFIAENKEIIGESLIFWTKPYMGIPAEEWEIPVNKPVWAPRYVANQIKDCKYHRLSTKDNTTGGDGVGQYYGTIVVDNTIQRLDAYPVSTKRSIFMGASGF